MEEEIHKRIIGQDDAVTVIYRAVRRARAGLTLAVDRGATDFRGNAGEKWSGA